MNEQLEKRVQLLEEVVFQMVKSNKVIFKKDIQMFDGRSFQFAVGTGTKIGTGTGQKFAFHGSTPVIQRASASQDAVATTGATNSTPYGYTSAAQADAIITLVNEIRATLVEKGLFKGSA